MKVTNKGQLIIALILIMTIVLAIGISIIQKSLVDVSTSTRAEQSSRAFSAAEAGIEKTLQVPYSPLNSGTSDIGDSSFTVQDKGNFPIDEIPQKAFELPALAKEEVAQVWLADPNNDDGDGKPREYYKPDDGKIDIYWGDVDTAPDEKPVLSAKILYYDNTDGYKYKSGIKPFDPEAQRALDNNFSNSSSACLSPTTIETNMGVDRKFQCHVTITSLPAKLMLIRFRMLYNSTSQPLGVKASGTCEKCKIPPQARIVSSTGMSGDLQRKVEVFKQDKIVPTYFDYAIFSAGDIVK